MNLPLISIVVCTYNRAGAVLDSLQSLCELEAGDSFEFDIVVVDNNSSDSTRQVLEAFAASAPVPVTYVFEKQQGVVFARNRGVTEAAGQWIAFFDDDQLADPQWLQQLWNIAQEKKVHCAGGGVHLKLPVGCQRNLHPFCQMLLGATTGKKTPQQYHGSFTPGCGNLLVKKELFDENGLFNPAFNGRGEDTDMFLRIYEAGNAAWFQPAAVVHHLIPAARLDDAFLIKLATVMSQDMASIEQRRWGGLLYPAAWLARVCRDLLVLQPRLATAWLTGNREQLIALRCRRVISTQMRRDGWRLIWRAGGQPAASPGYTTV